MLIIQQNSNTTMSIERLAAESHVKPINTRRLTSGHCTALQREEIQLHPPEHRHKFLQPENLYKPLVQPPPQVADSTIKRDYDPPASRKGTPNIAIQTKWKVRDLSSRWRNTIKTHQNKQKRGYLEKNS